MTEWTEGERQRWSHYDSLALGLAGIASTVFGLIYVANREGAYLQHAATVLLVVTIYMNLWSVAIRKLKNYRYKAGLVFASFAPFTAAIGIMLYLALSS